MIISEKLIGCRVVDTSRDSKTIVGKIIGGNVSGNGSAVSLLILCSNGDIARMYYEDIRIIKQDLAIINKEIQPESISDRFEIIDL